MSALNDGASVHPLLALHRIGGAACPHELLERIEVPSAPRRLHRSLRRWLGGGLGRRRGPRLRFEFGLPHNHDRRLPGGRKQSLVRPQARFALRDLAGTTARVAAWTAVHLLSEILDPSP